MARLHILLSGMLLGLASSPGVVFANEEDETLQKRVAALQQLVQKTISRVEPAVVCILVSRSADYERFGQKSLASKPGELGRFRPEETLRFLEKLGLPAKTCQQRISRLDLASPEHVPELFGSGVLLGNKGLVLTNYHLVHNATKLFVRLGQDKGSYADIYAADPRSDLAVLRLLDAPDKLREVALGAGKQAQRGQFILAISYPHTSGFQEGQRSASWGIISNIHQRLRGPSREGEHSKTLHHYGTLLQTDARIQCGCSGGAIFDMKGELIGLTTALAALGDQEGRGCFAIPMTPGMKRIIAVLRRGEEVEYGFLGVRVGRGDRKTAGVKISFVTPGSPADKSGLKPHDVILTVNGQELRDSDDLFLALGTLLAGTTAKLEVRKSRSQRNELVKVVLAKYYVPGKIIAAKTRRPFFRGLRVDDTSLLVQHKFPHIRTERIPQGVVVSEVLPNSPAATILLKPGEVITHVNNQVVMSPRDFYDRVRDLDGPVQLTILNSQPGKPSAKVMLN